MSSNISFDSIEFKPITIQQWKTRYAGSIRAKIDIKKIKFGSSTLEILDKQMVYGVWYSGGDWRDGKPCRLKIGASIALIRVPVLKLGKLYLMLDGMHRMKQLQPAIVLMDVLVVPKQSRKYIQDTFNEFWMDK